MKLTPLLESTQGPARTNHRTAARAPGGLSGRPRLQSIYPGESLRSCSRLPRFGSSQDFSLDLARGRQFCWRLPTNRLYRTLLDRYRIVGQARESRWRVPGVANPAWRVLLPATP